MPSLRKGTPSLIAALLAALLALALMPVHTAQALSFADVQDDAWYAWPVDWASDNGYITGYGGGSNTFGPDDPLQRGQAATILWRFAGSPAGSVTSHKVDVPASAYYRQGVDWAVAEGVMSGYADGTHFGPLDSLTREQLAIIIGHMAGVTEKAAAAADASEFNALEGHEDTSSWARPYVVWATHNHVINGVSGRYLDPRAAVTRAEMSAILLNSVNNGLLKVPASSPNAGRYTVVLDANDGTGVRNKLLFNVDAQMALPRNGYTRSGYTFTSWNTAANGSGTSYREGQAVTNLVPAGGSAVLYAQWQRGVRLNETHAVLYDNGELVLQEGSDAQAGHTVIAQGAGYQLVGSSDFALQCRLRATKITSDCDIYVNGTTLSAFSGWRRLRDISGLARWNVSNVTNMSDLFSGCSALSDLSPIKGWDVSGVTRMSGTFRGCTSLADLSPLSGWDVSKVFSMSELFYGDAGIESLEPLAAWDVSGVADLSSAFLGCSGVGDLEPLSGWDVSSAIDLDYAFSGCTSVADFTPLDAWEVREDASLEGTFAGVPAEAKLPVWYASA